MKKSSIKSIIQTHSLELTIKHTYQPLTLTGEESAETPGVSVETVRQEPSSTPDEQQQGSNNSYS